MVRAVYIISVKELRMYKNIKLPVLLILAVLMILSMLRLGIWQLDRAQHKQSLLDQQVSLANQAPVALSSISDQLIKNDAAISDLRFRQVIANGAYLADKSVYIDNQVLDGQVGYKIFTPLLLTANQEVILVDRGWLSVGESRAELPSFSTRLENVRLKGRLNAPPAQPPLWDDAYEVAQGQVWAYLPLHEYTVQMGLTVLPLVLELAPETSQQFKRRFAEINDEWVAKHQGYAFQWFVMAAAFFVACIVLLMSHIKRQSISE